MTRKHIYLNTSDFELIKDFDDDPNFEKVSDYPSHELQNVHRNEYGRITTRGNFYHLILGQLQQEGCPWCSSPSEVVKLSQSCEVRHIKYCIQCMHCGARGPIMILSIPCLADSSYFNECIALMWQRYKERRPWDDGLVNPYESIPRGEE